MSALSITTNVPSLFAQNALANTTSSLDTALQRLSTGLQINSGADGPAAYVISQQQQAQIAGLQTAISNTSQATDLVQTADGALGTISNLLTQIRGLALDSANSGVQDATSLAANQAQIQNALNTIDNIANNTQFGSKQILNGDAGINATTSDTADLSGVSATTATAAGTYTVAVTSGDVAQDGVLTVVQGADDFLDDTHNLAQAETLTITGTGGAIAEVQLASGDTNAQVAAAINDYTSVTGVVATTDGTGGTLQLSSNQFGQNFSVLSNVKDAVGGGTGLGYTDAGTLTAINTSTIGTDDANVTAQAGQSATVSVTDSNGNAQTVNVTNGNTVTVTGGSGTGLTFTLNPSTSSQFATGAIAGSSIAVADNSLTFQIGANAGQTATLAIGNVAASALGIVAGNQFANLSDINVTTTAGAQAAIAVIDQAINDVSTESGDLGAFQTNTLQSTATNLQATLTNTQSAESTIADTDYSSEIATYTQLQVQQQAGVSVLGLANELPQNVLTLLQKL
jgi:flagellin